MFSSRLPRDLTPNPLTEALAARRVAGLPVLDLTLSNPTTAGLDYPRSLLQPLARAEGLTYAPDPLGLLEAREAVAGDYARRGVRLAPDRIALTSSTSEAYSLLFKVLCEPGDAVLVPRPSYPLFDHLAALDAVTPVPYDLQYDGRWFVDLDSVHRAWTPRTRALVTVHPNNPTGSLLTPAELDRLAAVCRDRGAALIADEVFADYVFDEAVRSHGRVLDREDTLVVSLGGLSKTVGLPQLKLAWMAAAGPEGAVADFMRRLEFACDTYLSVSTPVQLAAAELLARGAVVREAIQARVRRNRARLRESDLTSAGATPLAADGGWSAVLQVPSVQAEEDLVLQLLEARGVLVHPGYFFDFPRESYLIVSLLVPEAVFAEGLSRIAAHLAASLAPGRTP
jgi:hypothetical protein